MFPVCEEDSDDSNTVDYADYFETVFKCTVNLVVAHKGIFILKDADCVEEIQLMLSKVFVTFIFVPFEDAKGCFDEDIHCLM